MRKDAAQKAHDAEQHDVETILPVYLSAWNPRQKSTSAHPLSQRRAGMAPFTLLE
jgi:hypothetical protein